MVGGGASCLHGIHAASSRLEGLDLAPLPGFVGWWRNPTGGDNALGVRYASTTGEERTLYPDFLGIYRDGEGVRFVVFDPHEDFFDGQSRKKWNGLAEYLRAEYNLDDAGNRIVDSAWAIIRPTPEAALQAVDLGDDEVVVMLQDANIDLASEVFGSRGFAIAWAIAREEDVRVAVAFDRTDKLLAGDDGGVRRYAGAPVGCWVWHIDVCEEVRNNRTYVRTTIGAEIPAVNGSGEARRHNRDHQSESAALVALLRAKPQGLAWSDVTTLIRQDGNVEALLDELDPIGLFATPSQIANREHAVADVAAWEAQGLQFLTILDDRYPPPVREIHQAPPFLFARGQLLLHDPAVSVVGSRNASERGLTMARDIAASLTEMNLTVIAGLALGIDAAAHRSALDAGGRTVAVIGTGINRQYPAASRDLHLEIAERGLLLSQFWPDAPPQRHNFLMRNATMSGYGVATVVVEAGEYSGTRAQARMAVEHGRPVVLMESVVRATDWGKSLVGRPGVRVASSVSDVTSTISEVQSMTERIDRALDSLVAV